MSMRAVREYGRFYRHIAAWAMSEIGHLVVKGEPGMGKSHALKTALEGRKYHSFGARQSALHVYNTIYDNPDWPVVFDDVGSLLRDQQFIDMLKGLCDRGEQMIRWGTTTDKLEGRETSVRCTSNVLILLNKVSGLNPDVQAVLDRCDTIEFKPTKEEIIAAMRGAFPERGSLIRLLAHLPVRPSFRLLEKAVDLAGSTQLDLYEELLPQCSVPGSVIKLVGIMRKYHENEWCAKYKLATGQSERSYRRHKKSAQDILMLSNAETTKDSLASVHMEELVSKK